MFNIYHDCINKMGPPLNWQGMLKDSMTISYKTKQLAGHREYVLNRLEALLDKYGDAMDSKLRNSIFDMANVLKEDLWELAGVLSDIHGLAIASSLATTAIETAIRSIKQCELWREMRVHKSNGSEDSKPHPVAQAVPISLTPKLVS